MVSEPQFGAEGPWRSSLVSAAAEWPLSSLVESCRSSLKRSTFMRNEVFSPPSAAITDSFGRTSRVRSMPMRSTVYYYYAMYLDTEVLGVMN